MLNTDDADPQNVMNAVLICAKSWAPEARIIGDVRAGDIVRAIEAQALELESFRAQTATALDTPAVTHLSTAESLETVLSQMEKEDPAPALVELMLSTAPWESGGQSELELRQGLPPDMTIVHTSASYSAVGAVAIHLNRIAGASIFQIRQSRGRSGEPLDEWFIFAPRKLYTILRDQGFFPGFK